MSTLANVTVDPKKSWQCQALKHDRQLIGCAFSPCGKFLFAGGTDKNIHRWELATEKKTTFAGHASWIRALEFHPDGKHLISADYVGQVHCWEYASDGAKPKWSIADAHTRYIRSISIGRDGKFLATAGDDRLVRVWNAADGKPLHKLAGHKHRIYSVAFHPDGKSIVSGDRQGGLIHWDATSGKQVRQLDAAGVLWNPASLSSGAAGAGVLSLAFDADGKTLACSGVTAMTDGDRKGGNASVVLVRWSDGKQERILTAKGGGFAERAVFHPAGYVIAACCSQDAGTTRFWQRDKVEPIHSIAAPWQGCRDLSLHPDGQRFALVQWEKNGKAGNNPSTKKLEEYKWHFGTLKIFQMTEKPAAAKAS